MRLDIDPRDYDKINDMAKAIIDSGKWKYTSSQFLQRDLKSGKTWAERHPEMISSLYKDIQNKIPKSGKKKLPMTGGVFGKPALSKNASYNKNIDMESDLRKLRAELHHIKSLEKEDRDARQLQALLKKIEDTKKQHKPFIKENKKWSALNNFKDLEQQTIKLLRKS